MSAVYSTLNILMKIKSKKGLGEYRIDKHTACNLFKVRLSGKYVKWYLVKKGFWFWKNYYVVIQEPIKKCGLSIRLEKEV